MKQFWRNKNGSALILSRVFVVFFVTIAAGLIPFGISQVSHTALNVNVVAAQYAAEAGAKRAIIGIENGRNDWAWIGQTCNLIDGDATRTYNVISVMDTSVTPNVAISGTPTNGHTYKITSRGTVNGVSKTVTATIAPTGGGIYSYAAYSKGAMNIDGGGIVTGAKIASDGLITVKNGRTVGDIDYTGVAPKVEPWATAGTQTKVGSVGTIDVASIMRYTPTMPTMPTMPTLSAVKGYGQLLKGATNPAETINLTGAYDYTSNPTSGVYYYGSGLADWWAKTYNVASGQKVFIYINGDYTVGMPITGVGDITIYAAGNIDVHQNITGSNLTFYAGGTITVESSSNITSSGKVAFYSGSNTTLQGKISGSNIGAYARGTITASGGSITGNTITLQSRGDFFESGTGISADSAAGIVNIYSGGVFDIGSGSIIGGTVTIMAGKVSGTALNIHGGSINAGKPTYITKIYANGNAELTATTLGGVSMIVATGSTHLYGMSSSALIISQGDIDAESGSAAGLYTNRTITSVRGATITYANNAANASTLGLAAGAGGTAYSVSWSNQ